MLINAESVESQSLANQFRFSLQPFLAAPHARDSAFWLTNKFRARNPAGLSNSSTARSDPSGDANHGRCNFRVSSQIQSGGAKP